MRFLTGDEIIGDSTKTPSKMYPYLFPIGSHKKVNLVFSNSVNSYRNVFEMSINDTIYAMRKGFITAPHFLQGRNNQNSKNKTCYKR